MKRRHHKYTGSGHVLLAVVCLQFYSALGESPELVSTRSPAFRPPAGGGGDSGNGFVSADGRYVLFSSAANNLATVGASNALPSRVPTPSNVFLRDRTNQTTTLVSVNLAGTAGGNADSVCTALSTNGRYALFAGDASDLVPNDGNNASDVFVRDLVAGTTILVSASTNGAAGNRESRDPVMTPDGRYAAFVSYANNLVPNDTNNYRKIFVRDLDAGTTVLAGSANRGYPYCDAPQITPDGRYVMFHSFASDLVPLIYPGDMYVHDLLGGTTTAVITNTYTILPPHEAFSYNEVISDDGRFVAFESAWTSYQSWGAIFRADLQSGAMELVSSNAFNSGGSSIVSRSLDMTPDGRFITFVGNTNTGLGTTTSAVFRWDGQTHTTMFVSKALDGTAPANSSCELPIIDASGQVISFLSTATNLTTNVISGGERHLYVHDLAVGTTKLVDVGTNGVGSAKSLWNGPGVTPDGRFVVFDCTDSDLVADDHNRACDVFLRDLVTETTELISARAPDLPSVTPGGDSGISPVGLGLPAGAGPVSVSADGRYIAFAGNAPDLVDSDTNRLSDVFLRDLLTGTNILISADTNGTAPSSGSSMTPIISADGSCVCFCSSANTFVAGDANRAQDIFIRNLATGTITLVTVSTNGFNSANADSVLLAMSADARYVLFNSRAKDLAPGYFNGSDNVFLRDVLSGTTVALTTSTTGTGYIRARVPACMSRDGHVVAFTAGSALGSLYVFDSQQWIKTKIPTTAGFPFGYDISPDGHWVAYDDNGLRIYDVNAKTNLLVSAMPVPSALDRPNAQFTEDGHLLVYASKATNSIVDTNSALDVYVYDLVGGTNQLISRSFSSDYSASGPSDLPSISGDGRFVTYRSRATNIVPGVTNGAPQTYLYDRQTGVTTLVGAGAMTAGVATHRAQAPVFSADSRSLVFRSWAPDLDFLDFNQRADVFSWRLASTEPILVFGAQMVFAPTSGKSPTLTWPAVTGKTYPVQFKDDLGDPFWQPMAGTVTIVGDRGYATDLAPSPSQRFYRIRAY